MLQPVQSTPTSPLPLQKTHIALQAFVASALHRRFAEEITKNVFRNLKPVATGEVEQAVIGVELRGGVRSRKTVPRTNLLAHVAAKHPIVHLALELLRNGIFQLNREVRNAA